jgi:hypothetical protein
VKQTLRETVQIQVDRLEEAMVTDRRWSPGDFEALLGHPLLGVLARRLVWGGYDQAGRLVWQFRVVEPASCVGLDNSGDPAEEVAAIGIVHPVQLTEVERVAWSEVLGVGRTCQPFLQLNRPFHLLDPDKVEQDAITWFDHLGVPFSFLWRFFQKQGWSRSSHQLALSGWAYVKQFGGAQVTAVLQLANAGGVDSSGRDEFICVQRGYFLPGQPPWTAGFEAPLPLGQVDPVVLSEVLSDLSILESRGQPLKRKPPVPPGPFVRPVRRMFDAPEAAVASNWMGVYGEDDIPF